MGILDDAIRQHLELKRQHGAPEEELQRQEEEALGPARRDVAPADGQDGDGEVELEAATEAPPEPGAPAELHDQETMLQEPEPGRGGPDAAEPRFETGSEPAVSPAEPPASEEDPASAEPPPSAPFDAGAETSFEDEVPAEDLLDPREREADALLHEEADSEEAGPDEEDADVLEDTPDFLQETPEHDRLWFEQKPPRDFDFD